ncbi:MAG: hypothetical protein HYR64_08900 [Fimbriimonas ginsengisoli]|uniref:Uncharacterized protein n=1 Tax=Fimbriimonas ginsengisoli TaxID=1005039 RepID=A0A931LTJ2_FIMGI|nr:hypothetical protein [Fimbriimonas ginsengisoli]
MVVVAFALLSILRPVDFGPAPIAAELRRGEAIAAKGKGIERTLLEDRVAVGRWFDGRSKRDVEEIVWLSPRMVSRWLGYLRRREGWTDAELDGRWAAARVALSGKLSFVVRLASLPRLDPLLEEDGPPGAPEEMDSIRISFAPLGAKGQPPSYEPLAATVLAHRQDREPAEALKIAWHQTAPLAPILGEEFGPPEAGEGYEFGESRSTVWLASCPLPTDLWTHPGFAVQVAGARRTRAAHFRLHPR